MKNILYACFLLCSGFGFTQEYFPSNDGVKTVDSNYRAFTGATIQIDPNTQVTDATLLIHQGKVVAAGKGIKLPKNTVIENAKGHLVAIQNASKSNFQVRNLPFYAGHAVQYGLSKEEALQLITLNTAKILGIDKSYGSLESGKNATLFISEGDALDMRTNQLTRAFIDGRDISLETHQTKLWKRYTEKYESQ